MDRWGSCPFLIFGYSRRESLKAKSIAMNQTFEEQKKLADEIEKNRRNEPAKAWARKLELEHAAGARQSSAVVAMWRQALGVQQ